MSEISSDAAVNREKLRPLLDGALRELGGEEHDVVRRFKNIWSGVQAGLWAK